MTSHAGQLQWSHSTTRFDSSAMFKDVGDGFRAEAGFVPQVGYRESSAGAGWTFRPTGFVSKLRTFVNVDRQVDRAGELIGRDVQPGVAMNTRWNGFMQFRYIDDDIRSGERIDRPQTGWVLRAVQPVAAAVDHFRQRHDRTGDRFRERAARHRNDDERQRHAQSDESSQPGAQPGSELGERRRCARRESAAVHRARVQSAGHLHVHVAHVRARNRAVRVNQSRSQSVYLQHRSPSRGRSAGRCCSRTS